MARTDILPILKDLENMGLFGSLEGEPISILSESNILEVGFFSAIGLTWVGNISTSSVGFVYCDCKYFTLYKSPPLATSPLTVKKFESKRVVYEICDKCLANRTESYNGRIGAKSDDIYPVNVFIDDELWGGANADVLGGSTRGVSSDIQ